MLFAPLPSALPESLAELHAQIFGLERWSLEQIKGSLALSSTSGLVAREEGELAAFILCQNMETETEILTLGVAPAHRRQGVAERLLREICARPKSHKIFLEVAADNLPAVRLYEKAGFKRMGARTAYYKRETGAVDALTYCYDCNP